MTVHHRPYRDDTDLRRLLTWLGTHTRHVRMHPGDLTWWLRQNTLVDPAQALELFLDDAGAVLGFVFSDPVTWVAMQGVPDLPDPVWDAMVSCAEGKAGAPVTFNAFERDAAQVAALRRHGYAPTPSLVRLERALQPSDAPPVTVPGGYRFADMAGGEVSAAARVELHREVWHPSKVTLPAFERLQAAPNYRADLDLMLLNPSGEPVAYALGWFDPLSRTGLMEPVGTRAAFRRRGLGRRVILELTRRLHALGAESVSIASKATNEAALGLYRSAGYRVDGEWMDYKRLKGQE